MDCELCGERIVEGNKVKVEGSVVVACRKCSSYGEIVGKVTTEKPRKSIEKEVEDLKAKTHDFSLGLMEELIDDYGAAVRNAREGRDMKQEELAKKINETTSLIKKIESERIEPNTKIARKIEGILNIKLIRKTGEEETGTPEKEERDELTLGDVIVFRKKEKNKKE